MITHSPQMEMAIALAKMAEKTDEVPVGAVIFNQHGDIIAEAHNRVETDNDPTAHAELLAIRKACEVMKSPRLESFSLYVTLEPCPMCAQAIAFSRIKSVYYGAYDPKGGGVENGPHIFNSNSCHHKPEVYGGIYEQKCGDLLTKFFQQKR